MNANDVYASPMMESLQRAADAIAPQMEVFARAVELAGQSVAVEPDPVSRTVLVC